MKWNRINSYWLLLLVLVLGLSLFLSVNQTQARYNTTAVWNTVINYEAGSLSSNCLSPQKQIILLGELPEEGSSIVFSLTAAQEVKTNLAWACDKQAYLEVDMYLVTDNGETALKQGDIIELPEGSEASIAMRLMPKLEILTEPREEIEFNVTVRCGDLSGTFRTTLPPIEPEETTAPIDPEATTEPALPDETTAPTEQEGVTVIPTAPEETTIPTESEGITIIPTAPEETTPPTESEEITVIPTVPEETTAPTESEGTTATTIPEGTTAPTNPEEATTSTPPEATIAPTDPEGTTASTVPEGPTDPVIPEETTKPVNSDTSTILTPLEETTGSKVLKSAAVSMAPGKIILLAAPETIAESAKSAETTDITESETTTEPSKPTETTIPTESGTLGDEQGQSREEESQTEKENISESVTGSQGDSDIKQEEETEDAVEITPLAIATLKSFDPTAVLPVFVNTTGDVQKLFVGIAGESENAKLQLDGFPSFTRYCWNDVSYLLYRGGCIELDINEQAEISLLLDFSGTNISSGGNLVLGAQAYLDDVIKEEGTFKVLPNVDLDGMETPLFLTTQLRTGPEVYAQEANEGASFTIELPTAWITDDVVLDYTIQMLSMDESGTVYQDVELTESGLSVEYVHDLNTNVHSLTVYQGGQLLPAGTYCINMSFSYKGVCFRELQKIFYIHYSAITQ